VFFLVDEAADEAIMKSISIKEEKKTITIRLGYWTFQVFVLARKIMLLKKTVYVFLKKYD